MSARSSFFVAWVLGIFGALAAGTGVARADDATPVQPPQVENSRYEFQGIVNAGSVFVRSGPGEGYYATQQLDKGATVTVVGIKFDWLKIAPPEGSYSYVGSVFVDRSGDGTTGRINRNDVNIRSGSVLNAMKTTVQLRLNAGDTVQVIGKEDEYLKIKPPTGAYLYVNKQFVDPVRALPGDAQQTSVTPAVAAAPATQPSDVIATVTPVNPVAPSIENTGSAQVASAQTPASPTTQPGQIAVTPTTQPVAVAPPTSEELFGKYEDQFNALTNVPLADQNIDELTTDYQSIAKADGLSDNLRTVVQFRIATLEARAQSKARLLEAHQLEADAQQKQLVLQAEQQELSERMKQNAVELYTAVGSLQASSLQLGGATLYRLTDPATGRTVVYIRTTDTIAAGLMNQFVGVKGDAVTDTQLSLRVITPTTIEQVDPAKVNGSIAAEIIPPSMLARQASASMSN